MPKKGYMVTITIKLNWIARIWHCPYWWIMPVKKDCH